MAMSAAEATDALPRRAAATAMIFFMTLLLQSTRVGSVFCHDGRSAEVKEVVEAHLEDVFVGAHVLKLGAGPVSGEDCREEDVLGAKPEVVVFELGGPVIEEGV